MAPHRSPHQFERLVLFEPIANDAAADPVDQAPGKGLQRHADDQVARDEHADLGEAETEFERVERKRKSDHAGTEARQEALTGEGQHGGTERVGPGHRSLP